LPPAPAEDTLTAAFAKNLFTLYVNALEQSGGALSDSDLSDIANQAMTDLSKSMILAPDFKSAQDFSVQGSGLDAMKSFAAAAEVVMKANKANATTSEIF